MNNTYIDELISDVKRELEKVKSLRSRVDFLERVLKQAVMTHNGELYVDPKLGQAASSSDKILDISGSGVRLMDDVFSNV